MQKKGPKRVLSKEPHYCKRSSSIILIIQSKHGLGDDVFPESEVIDLESDTGGDCNHWTNFPNYVVFGGTGALFDI